MSGSITLDYKSYDTKYDVVVIGGGTAGCIAAMAASREGAKTLLIEREFSLGGTSTLAQTIPRMNNHMTQDVMNTHLAVELQERAIKDGCGYSKNWFNPHLMKAVLEDMCEAYNVDILMGADFVSTIQDGEKITAVLLQTIDGLYAVESRGFIDATGNATVALDAGCPVTCGDKNGRNQPMSLRFSVSNVDIQKAKEFFNSIGLNVPMDAPYFEFASLWKYGNHPVTNIFRKGVEDGLIIERDGNYIQAFNPPICGEGMIFFNCPEMSHIYHATDPKGLTRVAIDAKAAARRIHNLFKLRVGGFENSMIQSFADMPGVRESRNIIGEYVVTGEDFANRLKTDEAIAQTAYPIDIHDEVDLKLERMQPGEYYEIPFQALIPKNVSNLLVAGRCISATFAAQASLRIQLVCMAMGEAAGIAMARHPEQPSLNTGKDIRSAMQSYGGTFADR